jgi:hypothetical protein
MPLAAPATHDAHALPLPRPQIALGPRSESGPAGIWRRVSFWLLEGLRLVAVVYLLPVAILAVGISLGLALTLVLRGAAWVWRLVW